MRPDPEIVLVAIALVKDDADHHRENSIMAKTQLNGSADRLAMALRDVVTDAMQPIRDDLNTIKKDMTSMMDDVSTLKSDMRYHKDSILDLRKQSAAMQRSVSAMKDSVDDLAGRVGKLER